MKNWLKKNWLRSLIFVSISWLVGTIALEYIKHNNSKQYKEKIAVLDTDIQQLRAENHVIGGINDDLRMARAEDKAAADQKIAEMKENQKKELARIGKERDEERVRVENLPAPEVVVETKIILIQRARENVVIELWERPGGILFSLDTAKTNLAILVDFSFVEKKRDQWKADYFKAMEAIKKKNEIIATDEEIFIGLDDINFNLEGIIEKKDEEFNLSEKRNVQMYWKGVKTGGLVLGIIGFIGGFVLGK